MRFSTVLQLSAASRLPAVAAAPAPAATRALETGPGAEPPRELPESLDERVRLVGEWQLGEG